MALRKAPEPNLAPETDEDEDDIDVEALLAEVEGLRGQAQQLVTEMNDLRITNSVQENQISELVKEVTTTRVYASKLNIENQQLKQAIGVQPEPPIKIAQAAKKFSKGRLKAGTANR